MNKLIFGLMITTTFSFHAMGDVRKNTHSSDFITQLRLIESDPALGRLNLTKNIQNNVVCGVNSENTDKDDKDPKGVAGEMRSSVFDQTPVVTLDGHAIELTNDNGEKVATVQLKRSQNMNELSVQMEKGSRPLVSTQDLETELIVENEEDRVICTTLENYLTLRLKRVQKMALIKQLDFLHEAEKNHMTKIVFTHRYLLEEMEREQRSIREIQDVLASFGIEISEERIRRNEAYFRWLDALIEAGIRKRK